MNQPLPMLFTHVHWIVFSYAPFKPSKVGMNVIHQVITQPYVTVIPATPTIMATINALSKSNGIQNLKITNLCGHLLFDSSMDPTLLAEVDDIDYKDTSFAGVYDKDTSFAGVPVSNTTIMTNTDDNSDAESDHSLQLKY